MHARVITVEAPPERFEDAIAAVESRVIRSVQSSPGFRGAYWLGNRVTGLIRALIFFASEQYLHASREPGGRISSAATDAGAARVTGVEEYEVVAATGEAVSRPAQFCRSLAWQEDPSRMTPVLTRITEEVMPGVRQNAGFQGGFWLVDRLSGRCVGFTLWDTAEHLQTSGAVGREMRGEPVRRGEMAILDLQEYAILARAEPPEGSLHDTE